MIFLWILILITYGCLSYYEYYYFYHLFVEFVLLFIFPSSVQPCFRGVVPLLQC